MCTNPIYLLNPTLKKIDEAGEIDIKKLRRYSGFRSRSFGVDKNGAPFTTELDNCVDMSYYDDKLNVVKKSLKGCYLPRYIKVPCGKCHECMRQKVNQMVARMYLEQKKHSDFGYFLTLSYDPEHCPYNVNEDGLLVPTLNKKDVQDFLKRLRITMSRKGVDISTFKYFCIGEYGMTNTDNKRPHYHLLLFFDVLPVNELYDFVAETWRNGIITLDVVNPIRLRYTANSHATASKLFPTAKGANKPFSMWSKGFGIPSPSDEKYIRGNMRVMIGDCQYPVDGYLRKKCFSQEELNEKGRWSASVPRDDDVLLKLESVMHRLYPRARKLDDLSPSEFDIVRNQAKDIDNTKFEQFYKRYVLKRKA